MQESGINTIFEAFGRINYAKTCDKERLDRLLNSMLHDEITLHQAVASQDASSMAFVRKFAPSEALEVIDDIRLNNCYSDRFDDEDVHYVNRYYFDCTEEAYDAAQTNEDVLRGDCLIIREEGVIALANAWPIAVTANAGEMHHVELGKHDILQSDFSIPKMHVDIAVALAEDYGLELAPWVLEMRAGAKAKPYGPSMR